MSTLGIVQGSASSPAAGSTRSRSWRQVGRSLRTRLFVLFLFAGMTPLLAGAALSVNQASGSLRHDALTAVADLAFNGSDKIDRNLFERYGDVQAFAKSDPARSMNPARLQAWMDTMMGT